MKSGLFRIVVRLLFIGLGALSCVSLAAQGFHVRVGPVLNYLIGNEEIILQQIFGELGQAAVRALHNLSKYFHWGWSLHLDPAWKHIFVILWLYFKQDVQQLKDIADDTPSQAERLKKAAMISRISGIVIAVLSGFCAGLVDTSSGAYQANLLFGSIPVIGFFIYAAIMAVVNALYMRQGLAEARNIPLPDFRKHLLQRLGMGAARAAAGFAVIAIGLNWPVSEHPAIFYLIVVWVLLALEWLRRGWGQAKVRAKKDNLTMLAAMNKTGNINLGLDMLTTIGVAFATIVFGV